MAIHTKEMLKKSIPRRNFFIDYYFFFLLLLINCEINLARRKNTTIVMIVRIPAALSLITLIISSYFYNLTYSMNMHPF